MKDYALTEVALADLVLLQQVITRYIATGFDLYHVSNVYMKSAADLSPAPYVLLIFAKLLPV